MLNLPSLRVEPDPFPHAVAHDFLPAYLYQALKASFLVCPPLGGPTGFSYFRGDPPYDKLVAEHPTWRTLAEALHTQGFIDYALAAFADAMAEDECRVPIGSARHVDHVESRAEKRERHLPPDARAPTDLWVRIDLLQGRRGYARAAHLDHRRRLLTMLIYFCDAEAIGMTGGDLVLHRSRDDAGVSRFPPSDNLMIAFPCSPRSWHSVSPILAQQRTRDFVQITISSPVDAWPSA